MHQWLELTTKIIKGRNSSEIEREMASEPHQNQPAKKPTVATDKEEAQQDLDFISRLPDEILHIILSELEIRDAAVTTSVSKRWAPLFPTLPSLKIYDDSFVPFNDPDYFPRYDHFVINRTKWVDGLFSVLNSRKTSVKKFDIEVDIRKTAVKNFDIEVDMHGLDADDLDPLLDVVCVAGVEELSIYNTGEHSCYETPLSIFNCNTIVELDIYHCKLEVPSQLTGLRAVKSLVLSSVTVADDDLQRMLSWCKAMEKLSIKYCNKVKNIVICAPNLSHLVIHIGHPVGVVFKSVPLLVFVSLSFGYSSDLSMKCSICYSSDDEESDSEKAFVGTNEATNLVDFLNKIRFVKNLHLKFSDGYQMILSKDGMALPTSLSPNCYLVELKKLYLSLPLNYNTFNMFISCLLNISPNLMEIAICYSSDSPNALKLNFWKKQLPAECVKHHLTTATFCLSEDCFGLPKFLLQNAGNLKNMNVFYYGKFKLHRITNTGEKIGKELFAIQMASPDVKIMIKRGDEGYIPGI